MNEKSVWVLTSAAGSGLIETVAVFGNRDAARDAAATLLRGALSSYVIEDYGFDPETATYTELATVYSEESGSLEWGYDLREETVQ